MADKTWKAGERALARLVGGERVPVTGRSRGSAPDIEHPDYSFEIKHRAELPDWLHDAMDQAEQSVEGDKVPVVVLHEKGKPYAKCLVLLRFDSIAWFPEGGDC